MPDGRGNGVVMPIERCYAFDVERVAQVFSRLADADSADEECYASLSADERVDILLDLVEAYRDSLGPTAERFERVCRVTDLSQG